MRRMKLLAGLIVLVMVAGAGWWWMAAQAHEAAIRAWLDGRRAAGWQAEAAVSIAGFPNRLDLTFEAVALADPASGWAWEAPRFEIDSVIWDPTFYVAAWPPEQRVAAPGARATVRSESMRASFRAFRETTLPLERASFDALRPSVEAEAGWTAGAERLGLHIRAAPGAGPANAYEFRADAVRLRLPDFLRVRLDPAGALPPAMEIASAEGRVAFDRPLDRFALEGRKPGATHLTLKEARAEWGGLRLLVSGAAEADAEGYAEGEFDIRAENWSAMLDAAEAAGAVTPGFAETLRAGLGFLARLGGDGTSLDVALVFSGGRARIGPVPVGAAPRMISR